MLFRSDLVGGGHALAARENGGRQSGDERKAVHHDDSISREMIFDYRKLFKNPISERWGKQICLN